MSLKQAIFLTIINKFITLWREYKGEANPEHVKEQFPKVKVMKLFFFFCLFDEQNYFRREQGFDKFIAYPLGPVHEESYFYLKSEEGSKMFESLCKNEEIPCKLPDNLSEKINSLLKNNFNNINLWQRLALMPVDELVELSHTTQSWKSAFFFTDKHEMDIDKSLREDRSVILASFH